MGSFVFYCILVVSESPIHGELFLHNMGGLRRMGDTAINVLCKDLRRRRHYRDVRETANLWSFGGAFKLPCSEGADNR